jgi:hypothetical protein
VRNTKVLAPALIFVALALAALAATLAWPRPLDVTAPASPRVDDHPLYTMRYDGDADCAPDPRADAPAVTQPWACTLFCAFGAGNRALAGRNFDWDASPALLLFTHPHDGYASISMVNLGFVGVDSAGFLTAAELEPRLARAAVLPTDGMNEHGLFVGMAAVPDSQTPRDPSKATIGSLCAIRLMLDHARNTAEAVALLKQYNIDFTGGPQIHYLLGDATGHSAVVEYKAGTMQVLENSQPWQVATNFHLAGSTQANREACWRYTGVDAQLARSQGAVSPQDGMGLLQQASQQSTQWSVVYDLRTGDVRIAMGRKYDAVRAFQLPLAR